MWPFEKKPDKICALCGMKFKKDEVPSYLHAKSIDGEYRLPMCESCAQLINEGAIDG